MAKIEDANLVVEEGTLLRVTMEIRLPCAAAEDQIAAWLGMEVGKRGGLSIDNPLSRHEPEAWGANGVQFEDLGVRGREERFDIQHQGNGNSSYRIRYHRDPK